MHKDLLFVGDSFTFGMELEPEHEEYRFSHLVATDKNLTYENLSQCGACNDWIIKTAIQYFRSGNTCDTAIIQFTAPERWRYYDTEKEKWRNIGYGKGRDPKEFKSQATRDAHSAYYQYIYSPQLAIENYWKNVFFIDDYLKDKCKTIYLTLGNGLDKSPKVFSRESDWAPDTIEIGVIKQIVGKSKIIGHPSKEGHRKIANHILKNF